MTVRFRIMCSWIICRWRMLMHNTQRQLTDDPPPQGSWRALRCSSPQVVRSRQIFWQQMTRTTNTWSARTTFLPFIPYSRRRAIRVGSQPWYARCGIKINVPILLLYFLLLTFLFVFLCCPILWLENQRQPFIGLICGLRLSNCLVCFDFSTPHEK